jgi:two-component sensor histidine kinase
VADDGHVLIRLDRELDVVEYVALRVVAEGDALEVDPPRAGRKRRGVRLVRDLLRLVQHLKIRSPDAVARWDCPIHMPSIRSGMISMVT